jgi:hypothetical protein
MRLAIMGGPKTGKTTLANTIPCEPGLRILHTDDAMRLGWSECSEYCSYWFNEPSVVVEGVAVARSLRKWLERNPTGKPCDEIVYLTKPHVPLTKGQAAMAKGVETVFVEIEAELLVRGVHVRYGAAMMLPGAEAGR